MSEIRDVVLAGKPIKGIDIIDVHTHIGPYGAIYISKCEYVDFIKSLDMLGVNKAIVSAHMAVSCDHCYGNDIIIDFISKYSDRIYGYASINPNDKTDIIKELDRCFIHNNMIGIKILPGLHNRKIDSEDYDDLYKFASKKKIPVLIHTWGETEVLEFSRVCEKYGDFPMIMAHSGADYNGMIRAIEVANKFECVYLDLALSNAPQGNVEWFLNNVCVNKILYGSDMQYFDAKLTFGRVALADISDSDKKLILGENAKRIFNF